MHFQFDLKTRMILLKFLFVFVDFLFDLFDIGLNDPTTKFFISLSKTFLESFHMNMNHRFIIVKIRKISSIVFFSNVSFVFSFFNYSMIFFLFIKAPPPLKIDYFEKNIKIEFLL